VDKKQIFTVILTPVLLFLLIGCEQKVSNPSNEEILVARVHDRTLSRSTLNQIIHSNSKTKDSTAMANAYVDQWTRDQLMMRQASRLFSADTEVERLVNDYRESLLMHQLEDKIILERFDTTITSRQLDLFYNEMKPQFTLPNALYRCAFYKFSRDTKSIDQFYKDWKKEDDHAIRTFAAAYGVELHTDSTMWYTWKEIEEMNKSFVQSISDRLQGQRQIDKEYQYFLKIYEKVDKGAFSPLGYVAPQLSRMLLHKRKQKMLEAYKQELYEKALRENIVRLRI
jgi:hypothetical protein